MKFTCLQENLNHALTKVYRAIPTKSDLPILSNILITAQDNNIKLSATNLSTTIITHVGASIEKEGAITVPAKMLRDFVSNLTPNTLEVDLTDDILHMISASSKSKFNGVSAEDYPDLPERKKEMEILEIDPAEFYKTIASVAFSASTDDSRPIFTGIYFSFDGKDITLAASDGFRLSESKLRTQNSGEPFSIILPAKTLIDVARVFSDSEEKIKFTLDKNDNLAVFEQEDTMIATRMIDGEYPDYQRIVPQETAFTAIFAAGEFLQAVKLTDIFAKEADSALIMKVDPEGYIEITASAQEAGEHSSRIVAEVEGEEPVSISFNSKFLLDFLNNIKEEKIELRTKGNLAPCLFKSKEKENFFHIIMPMQINS